MLSKYDDEIFYISMKRMRETKKGSLERKLVFVRFWFQQLARRISGNFRSRNDRLVVFNAYTGQRYACSPRAIYEAMLTDKRFKSFSFVWILPDTNKYRFLLDNPRTTIVKPNTPAHDRVYAQAKYWVANNMLPLELAKLPDQMFLQCWHGTPLKRLRDDIVETDHSLDTASDLRLMNNLDTGRFDYFVSQSSYASRHFSTAFSLPELGKQDIIIETGYPRNDFLSTFTDADVARAKESLGIPKGKKVLLYAPTWRDDQYSVEEGYTYDLPIDFKVLQDQLGDDYVVLLRLHYLIADTIDFHEYAGFAYDVSGVEDINQLFIISDVLVTDYSSLFFDYLNLKRPVLFYMYDKEHYEKELRGFYLPVEKLPGDIVTTQAVLTEQLRDLPAYAARTKAAVEAFHDEFNYLDDGNAATRVIDAVWSDLKA